MDTRQIISTATEVTTISRVRPGDVYKRVENSGYDGTVTLRFGVILDAMNNGVDSAITAVEYRPADYGSSGVTIQTKVWKGGDLALFPATPDEVRQHLADLTAAAEKSVTTAQDGLARAREQLSQVERLAAQLTDLTTPETTNEPAEEPWHPEKYDRVAYQPHPDVDPEYGEVTDYVSTTIVRVRYDGETTAKATRIADLTPEVRGG